MTSTVRKTRKERREQALSAAREEFARAGMKASVDLIAGRAGVGAPYLLRLFGTKKALFLAVVERARRRGVDEDLQIEAALVGDHHFGETVAVQVACRD